MTSAVTADARKTMKSLYRAPEPDVLKPLLDRAAATPEARERIMGHASGLLADLRAAQNRGWVNQFLQEYRLNSSEGVALLSLAEAFLRVPDPETADLLIADKLGEADWRAHTGRSASKLVNSATWGWSLAARWWARARRDRSSGCCRARASRSCVRRSAPRCG